jgi:hypothetical protein
MSTMALLTYGRDHNLSRKEGWLRDLLIADGIVSYNIVLHIFHSLLITFIGIMDKSKAACKERIWDDYRNQESFREGMQAVVGNQPVFDARTFPDRGKDGQFKPQSKNKKFVPKNIVTAHYLVWAYAVPYQRFLRWKREGFASQKKYTYHKGKSVTNSEYARQIHTAKRMYVTSAMDVWKAKQMKTYGEIKLKAKQEYCAKTKQAFHNLTEDEKVPFEKLARDHQVKQALMAECIAESLQKKKEGIACALTKALQTPPTIGAVMLQFTTG